MHRNWSRQLNVRTLKLPRYLVTRRRNVYHGANSMTCAKTSLPACIGASQKPLERLAAKAAQKSNR